MVEKTPDFFVTALPKSQKITQIVWNIKKKNANVYPISIINSIVLLSI